MPETISSTRARALIPGVLLCSALSLAALALQGVEQVLTGRAWLEAVVLAILLGTLVRTWWTPGARWQPGIDLSGKFLLEVAVVLLGATLSAQALAAAGPTLLIGVMAVVALAIPASIAIGRLFGLPWRMTVLIACGNSICGNSAIAAVAPVIGADSDDVAASIAFTAVLGVAVVLLLPLTIGPLELSDHRYGVLAGLTVYAVPQVLAATLPVGAIATQVGTLVKLVRVLMLGPVVLFLSLFAASRVRSDQGASRLPPPHKLVPWFIIGFLALAALRSLELIPAVALAPTAALANALTILAMAALGLGVNLRAVAAAGPRVTAVVTLSIMFLGAIAVALLQILPIP